MIYFDELRQFINFINGFRYQDFSIFIPLKMEKLAPPVKEQSCALFGRSSGWRPAIRPRSCHHWDVPGQGGLLQPRPYRRYPAMKDSGLPKYLPKGCTRPAIDHPGRRHLQYRLYIEPRWFQLPVEIQLSLAGYYGKYQWLLIRHSNIQYDHLRQQIQEQGCCGILPA